MNEQFVKAIEAGDTALGIEFGSTRIKAVLVDAHNEILAVGTHDWASHMEGGYWTYTMEDALSGMASAVAALRQNAAEQYGVPLTRIGYLGVSALMHGYLPFDAEGNQLTAFRTYRNTTTEEASRALTEAFGATIPQRWSVAHLYQAHLNKEEHLGRLASITTLAGYVHLRLSGRNVLGIGDASGVFPIDDATRDYDSRALGVIDDLMADAGYGWKVRDLLPDVLKAGQEAGSLTEEGALLLDPTGELQAGALMCPPEGDAGTGMVATNSVAVRTGNVSVGTSVFGMIVLDKPLTSAHEELDPVTTPEGEPVAMVHTINGTVDLDAWVNMFKDTLELMGADFSKPKLYDALYEAALSGDRDGGGIVAYNYVAGEHVTGLPEGRPMLFRTPESKLSISNVMRTHLMALFASFRVGLDVLTKEEGIEFDQFLAHGGIFKSELGPQRILAAATGKRVVVGEGAGEGGAWGIAMLANYLRRPEISLSQFLTETAFKDEKTKVVEPDAADVAGYNEFLERYKKGLAVQRAALEV